MRTIMTTLAVGTSLAACVEADDHASDRALEEVVSARFHCEKEIKTRLKAPRTARFSDVIETKVKCADDPETATRICYVEGWVDAENSFGATLRTSYGCLMERRGDAWSVVNAALDD